MSKLFIVLFCAVYYFFGDVPMVTAAETKPVTQSEAHDIAMQGYYYLFPLVVMDITRRQMTSVPAGQKPGFGPANAFHHMRAYPDAALRVVVRPNFDTLYSPAWIDLTKEPLIVSVPDTAGRYYLLPMLDMWTDVFASPGWRTSGTGARNFALVGPGWSGTLPANIERIDSPTAYAWIIGRTQTNGPADYEAVHKVQDGLSITPLSQWGKTVTAPEFKPDPTIDLKTEPLRLVSQMQPEDYFTYGAELMKANPPHITDWSMLAKLKRVGFEPGKKFALSQFDAPTIAEFRRGTEEALKQMQTKTSSVGQLRGCWSIGVDTMGVYGDSYFKRAIVALAGLGANQPEDAIYPISVADSKGAQITGDKKYTLHFSKEQLPPVDAFWSVTMYDKEGFQVANPINRFAVSSWMPFVKNADGSLDLYVQHDSPGKDKEANWLPSPASGEISLTMRLYAPKPPVLNGDWTPPPIVQSN